MSLRTLLRSRISLSVLAVALTAVVLLYLTDYQRKTSSARNLLSSWHLVEANSILRSLVEDDPSSLEVRRMYAECLFKRGELKKGRDEYAALLRFDSTQASSHQLSLAFVHFFLGNLDTASSLANQIPRRAPFDSSGMARAFNLLGRIAFNQAQYDSAMLFQRSSLTLAHESGASQIEADALRQIGVLYWYHGKADSARMVFYEPALDLYRRYNDRIGEATTLNNIGLAGGGLKYFLEAFAIRMKIGDQIGLADSYYFVTSGSSTHWFDVMYSFRKKSLELSRRIGYKWGEEVAARAVEDMVVSVYDSVMFDPRVAGSGESASGEQIIQRMKRKSSELAREGKWREAAALHERIIAMSDSMGYSIGLGQSLQHYIAALLPLGEYKKAESVARRLQKVLANAPLETGFTLAEVYLASGQHDQAAELLTSLTKQLDEEYLSKLRQGDVSFPLESARMLTFRYTMYSKLMDALEHRGLNEEIFGSLERFRSLPLGFGVEPGNGSLSSGDESIWHRYVRTLEGMEKDPDDIDQLMMEFEDADHAASERTATVSNASQTLYERTIPEMDDVQRALTDDQVLLEFFVGNEEAYAFALRRDKSLFLQLHQSAANVNSSVRAFRDLLLRGKTLPENELWKGPASFLFRTLVQPLIERGVLKEGDRLIISPHARLHDVPFACLADSSGRLLVEQYTVSYVPTASSILPQRGTTELTTFLAFVPDTKTLPFAEREVAGVPSRLFASYKAQLNDEASGSELIQRAQGFDVIHIAAHGSMHRWDPLFSHLRLSDGPFELYKILDLKLSARLVVLSACETGYGVGMMGDIAQGHEVVSFPRAFLHAGASCVIAPLWVVEDEATSHLMTSFYANLASLKRSDGSYAEGSFARALALAQRQFIGDSSKNHSQIHPFYWAGFYLTGSPN